MFAGLMSRCITPAPVHPRHGPGQRHRQPEQLVDGQRRRQRRPGSCRRRRPARSIRVPRRVHQLRDPLDPAQPLQHRRLVPQPALRVRPQRLLADHRASGEGTAE